MIELVLLKISRENRMKTQAQKAYDDFISAGAASLPDNAFWCVFHPDGPLEDTASKDLGHPVRVVCDALNADWDDLVEQGYRLGVLQKS